LDFNYKSIIELKKESWVLFLLIQYVIGIICLALLANLIITANLEPNESGFIVDGEVRDIKLLTTGLGDRLAIVSRNNDTVKTFLINP